jgi:N-acyl-D-amino-acid deacylase
MLAQRTAREHGFAFNADLFQTQAAFTQKFFSGRIENMRRGTGIGGQSMSIAYALWALHLADWPPDETTEAMATYLLKTQEKDGRFSTSATRPPLQDSPAMSATLAAYYLQQFATKEQEPAASETVARSALWLQSYEPIRQEDRNALLWGFHLFDADQNHIDRARIAVLDSQREDGGWSQLPDMESDSYATGQALWTLQETGLATDAAPYQRGLRYLLDTQREDGSWHVKTRAKAIQTYYESGFPHGVDQFISICGTSWAVAALAASQPRPKAETP